eukprot:gene17192-20487_t
MDQDNSLVRGTSNMPDLLGHSVNFLNGLGQRAMEAPYLDSAQDQVLDHIPSKPLVVSYAETTTPEWKVTLDLCETSFQLVDKIYDFSTLHEPIKGIQEQVLGFVSKKIGIDLLNPEYKGYALVKITKECHSLVHPAMTCQDEKRSEFIQKPQFLEQSEKFPNYQQPLTVDAMDQVHQFTQQYGTHFVSHVTIGDCIYQVFAYTGEIYKQVCASFAKPEQRTGDAVGYFALMTKPARDTSGFHGKCVAIGQIVSSSGDPELAHSIERGEWMDELNAEANSVFKYFFAGGIASQIVEKIQSLNFTNLSYFFKNSKPCYRLFIKSYMALRHGKTIDPSFRDTKELDDTLACYKSANELIPSTSYLSTSSIDLFRQRYNLDELNQLCAPEVVESLLIVTNVLVISNSAPIKLPGRNVTIIAHHMEFLEKQQGDSLIGREQLGERISVLLDMAIMQANGIAQRPDVTPATLAVLQDFYQYIVFLLDSSIVTSENLMRTRLTAASSLNSLGMSREFMSNFVPYLNYNAYGDAVASLQHLSEAYAMQLKDTQLKIELRKTQETVVQVGQQLNENIMASGKLLLEYIGASAQKENDMNKYYEDLLGKTQDNVQLVKQTIATLKTSQEESRSDISKIRVELIKAYEDYAKDKSLSMTLDIINSMFSIGMALPGLPEKPIDSIKKIWENGKKIKESVDGLNALDTGRTKMASSIQEMAASSNLMTMAGNISNSMPSELDWSEYELANYAVIDALPKEIKKREDLRRAVTLFVLRSKALLSAMGKLSALESQLFEHDRLSQISSKQRNRLQQISKAYTSGDIEGIHSKVDLKPDVIDQYDILSLNKVLATQSRKIVDALNSFNPPPSTFTPVNVVINAKSRQLINGATLTVDMPITQKEFYSMAMVRITRVLVSIRGIKSTKSGKYSCHVSYDGGPFFDRGLNRETLTFDTVTREMDYVYSTDGTPQFGVEIGSFVIDEKVDVVFTFEGESLWKDVAHVVPHPHLRMARSALAAPPNTGRRSLEGLTGEMSACSVMQGWDAVLALDMTLTNNILKHQYDTDKDYQNIPRAMAGTEEIISVFGPANLDYDLKFGAASLIFSNNDEILLHMDISGQCTAYAKGSDASKGNKIDIPTGSFLEGSIPNTYVQGQLSKDKTYDVYLELAKGKWSLEIKNGSSSDTNNINTLNTMIGALFAKAGFKYLLSTISSVEISGCIADLIPSYFKLSCTQTISKMDVIQLFIMTGSHSAPSRAAFNIEDPIPQGSDSALYISNRVVFGSIVKGAFSKTNYFPMLFKEDASDYKKFSYLECDRGSMSKYFDGDNQIRLQDNASYVTVPLKGANVKSDAGKMVMKLVTSWTVDYEYKDSYTTDTDKPVTVHFWVKDTSTISLNVGCPINFTCESNDQNSINVKCNPTKDQITCNVSLKAGAKCPFGKDDYVNPLQKTINDTIPDDILTSLKSTDFTGVSVFALKSLLFPGKYLNLGTIQVPGDLLMVGTLSDLSEKK